MQLQRWKILQQLQLQQVGPRLTAGGGMAALVPLQLQLQRQG